jgi:hypothetical protein
MAQFSDLPAELLIQIYESLFVPRRIILKQHSHRPPLSPRSPAALLLVNTAARQIFLSHHTLSFHEHGLKGIYINYSKDTLCLTNGGLRALKKLLRQYPNAMQRVRWLEIPPHAPNHGSDVRDLELGLMSSLRVLTVRWGWEDIGGWKQVNAADTMKRLRDALSAFEGSKLREKPRLAMVFVRVESASAIKFENREIEIVKEGRRVVCFEGAFDGDA